MGTIARFVDAGYINQSQFQQLFDLAEKCSRQISRFMSYLLAHPDKRRISENQVEDSLETFQP